MSGAKSSHLSTVRVTSPLSFVFLLFSCFVLFFLSSSLTHADGVSWLESNVNADGSIGVGTDISTSYQSTAETLRAFHELDDTAATVILGATRFINDETFHSTENLSRKIIMNVEQGQDVTSLLDELKSHQNRDGGFGELPGYDSTVIDTSYALNALAVTQSSDTNSAGRVIDFLIAKQSSDGGFSHSSVNQNSIYETALASIALQYFRFNFNLSSVIDGTSQYLLSNQVSEGGWGTIWETAYALLALVPVTNDITSYQAGVDTLKVAQLPDGSWGQDVYVTALALKAIHKAENVQDPQDPTEGIFTGQVFNVANSQPLAGVVINLMGVTGVGSISSIDGTFSITGVEPGEHTISFSAAGFTSVTQTATAVAGRFTSLGVIQLISLPNKGIVFGVVRDSETNQAIESATVNVNGSTTITNSDGFFSVELDPGQVLLSIQASGFDPVFASADISAGQQLNFSPLLNLTGTTPIETTVETKITIVDANTNLPIQGAFVSIKDTDISGVTDVNGISVLKNIVAGLLNIEVVVTNYQLFSTNIIAPEGSVIDLGVVSLSKTGEIGSRTVKGFVTNSVTGAIIPGATVSVEGTSIFTVSNSEGYYFIEDTGQAISTLIAKADGFLQTKGEINHGQLGDLTINIQLNEGFFDGININRLQADAEQYFAYSTVKISSQIKNTGTIKKSIQVIAEVINFESQVVSRFFPNPINIQNPADIQIVDGVPAYEIEAGELVELDGSWFTGDSTVGAYNVRFDVFSTDSNQLLSQKFIKFSIVETKKINITVEPSPSYTNFEAEKQVEIIIKIQNLSNVPIGTKYNYSFLDPDGKIIKTGLIVADVTPKEPTKLLVADNFSYTFNKTGVYTVKLQYQEGITASKVLTGTITVAPTVRAETTQNITPSTVFPDGDKRIRIQIQLKGVEQK